MARMLSMDPDDIKRPENEEGNFEASPKKGNWKLIGLSKLGFVDAYSDYVNDNKNLQRLLICS